MRALGRGHSESVYHKALITLLNSRNISHRSEVICPIMFMGECVGVGRADLIVDDVVVEIKAIASKALVTPQLRKYLVSMSQSDGSRPYYGLILNFNTNTGNVDSHEEVHAAKAPARVAPSKRLYEDLVNPEIVKAEPVEVKAEPMESISLDFKLDPDVEVTKVERPESAAVIDLDSVIEPLRFRPYERSDGRPSRTARPTDFLRVPSKNVLKY
jgi:GxxExxY protein